MPIQIFWPKPGPKSDFCDFIDFDSLRLIANNDAGFLINLGPICEYYLLVFFSFTTLRGVSVLQSLIMTQILSIFIIFEDVVCVYIFQKVVCVNSVQC